MHFPAAVDQNRLPRNKVTLIRSKESDYSDEILRLTESFDTIFTYIVFLQAGYPGAGLCGGKARGNGINTNIVLTCLPRYGSG
jgi:hypothetical protein